MMDQQDINSMSFSAQRSEAEEKRIPIADEYHIYVDGCTEGWNGPLGTVTHVGIGFWCKETNHAHSERVQGISVNEAEFKALIKAMEWAIEQKLKMVHFFSDSKIITNRANGKRPKSKKHRNERMDCFQDRVLELAKQFNSVSFTWIPREQNDMADYFSKYYIENPGGGF